LGDGADWRAEHGAYEERGSEYATGAVDGSAQARGHDLAHEEREQHGDHHVAADRRLELAPKAYLTDSADSVESVVKQARMFASFGCH
jgi:hypothetical protein